MSSATKTLKAETVFDIINRNDKIQAGKVFGVKFIKRTNGEVRTMSCRLSKTVENGKTGEGMKFNPTTRNLIPVLDMSKVANNAKAGEQSFEAVKHAFRMIDAESVLEIKVDGAVITPQ